MDIREYIDMEATEKILRDWTKITGMTCVIVDEEGGNLKYRSGD